MLRPRAAAGQGTSVPRAACIRHPPLFLRMTATAAAANLFAVTMPPLRRSPMAAVTTAVVAWGFGAILVKVMSIDGISLSFYRFWFGTLLMLAVVVATRTRCRSRARAARARRHRLRRQRRALLQRRQPYDDRERQPDLRAATRARAGRRRTRCSASGSAAQPRLDRRLDRRRGHRHRRRAGAPEVVARGRRDGGRAPSRCSPPTSSSRSAPATASARSSTCSACKSSPRSP